MKKIYTLAIALFGVVAFAQTPLNTNGSLETWTDGAVQADGWFMSNANLNNGIIVRQTGTEAQDGNVYLKLMPRTQSSGNNSVAVSDLEIESNTTYTIKYWYKSEDNDTRARHWAQFRKTNPDNPDGTVNISVGNDVPFQPTDNLTPSVGEWTEVVATMTSPADAEYIRLEFRNYANSSPVYIDNVIVFEGTASVKNNNIEGLSVYPNPATGNTLYVTSNNSVDKSVAIFDVLGKQVINTTTVNGAVNIANLNAGVYIVKVTEEGKTATRKLVVK